MSVNSISKRTTAQTSAALHASATRTTGGAAAEFASALQRANASLFPGAAANGAAGLLADAAQQDEQAKAAEQDRAGAATKAAQRHRARAATRPVDLTIDGDKASTASAARTADDAPRPAATKHDDEDSRSADDDRVATADLTDNPQPTAAPVPPPAQAAAEPVDAEAPTTDDLTDARLTGEEAAKAPIAKAQADTDAAIDADDANGAENPAAKPPQPTARPNSAAQGMPPAQAQAQDLARRLDDTGAQVKVQVAVTTETAAPAAVAPSVAAVAADAAASQPAAASTGVSPTGAPPTGAALTDAAQPQAVAPVADAAPQNGGDTPSGQSDGGQNAAMAGAGQQPAQAPQSPAGQVSAAFNAALAAQAEAVTGQKADTQAPQSSQSPTLQPGAALSGVGANAGLAFGQRAQAPQAATGTRQPATLPSQEVLDQIAVHIAKHGSNGGNSIKVQLKPVELGAIEIKVEMAKDGTATTVVTADNQDTLNLLKKDQDGLQKALEQAGLKSNGDSISFNLREGNQQQANQQQGGAVARRRARMAAAAAVDDANAQAAAAAQARWGVGRSGVDIQV